MKPQAMMPNLHTFSTFKTFTLFKLCIILAGLYLAFCAYLFLFQDHLLFFPTKMSEERWKYVADDVHADYVTIRVNEEGNHLQGWFIAGKAEKAGGAETSPQEQKLPTVIFFR